MPYLCRSQPAAAHGAVRACRGCCCSNASMSSGVIGVFYVCMTDVYNAGGHISYTAPGPGRACKGAQHARAAGAQLSALCFDVLRRTLDTK